MSLKELRKKIDELDARLLKILNQRAKKVIKISSLKKKKKSKFYVPEREAYILSRLRDLNNGPLSSQDIENIFGEILSVCRSLRADLRIAYLGPPGTFTHLAGRKKFGKKPEYLPVESISEVFDRVEKGEADYGVVPIENSIEGVVTYTQDMFFTSPLKICSEITHGISHSLLGQKKREKKTSLKRIYSNSQVFSQCRRWILETYPEAELVPVASTAKAAQRVKKDAQGVCIGNPVLADIYDLEIIASSIEDSTSNVTRFLVVAPEDSEPSGCDKTSLLFAFKDRVGALHDILAIFKKYNINLTKIESRPSKRKLWEYYFFVDFQGHRNSSVSGKVLSELEESCSFVKVLGSYPMES